MSSSAITCEHCGGENPPQAVFCFSCGQPLAAPSGSLTGLLPASSLLKQRYRILSQVGKGGFGAVYVAEDTQQSNRLVAVKEMSQRGLTSQELKNATEAFQHEGKLLGRLNHAGLPAIYDHFSEAGRWYLVMEFIGGETLEAHLAKAPGGRLPVSEVVQIGLQLCSVLNYLHSQQPPIIFRDLKPANIMLTPKNMLYLIDFGIARLFKPGQAKDTIAIGSIGYAAPEQYGKTQTTIQSDIYSLGATLHHLLSGNDPADHPFTFQPLNLAQPAGLELLILQMVERDPQKRPAAIGVVQQQLHQMAGDQPADRKRRWSASLGAAVRQQLQRIANEAAAMQQQPPSPKGGAQASAQSSAAATPASAHMTPLDPLQPTPGIPLVMVVCPLCLQQHLYPLGPGYSTLLCPNRRKTFLALFAKTRSKRSYARLRTPNRRSYQIRVTLPDTSEQRIEFPSKDAHFDLHAGDDVIIAYRKNRPKVVMNPARHRYMLSAW
jgi:serine/threonine protein kinase